MCRVQFGKRAGRMQKVGRRISELGFARLRSRARRRRSARSVGRSGKAVGRALGLGRRPVGHSGAMLGRSVGRSVAEHEHSGVAAVGRGARALERVERAVQLIPLTRAYAEISALTWHYRGFRSSARSDADSNTRCGARSARHSTVRSARRSEIRQRGRVREDRGHT